MLLNVDCSPVILQAQRGLMFGTTTRVKEHNFFQSLLPKSNGFAIILMAQTGMTLIYGVDMVHLVCNNSENRDQ